MKKIKLLVGLVFISSIGLAQLKVDQFGRIGMGTSFPNSGYKCHIKGNLLLTTYPSIPFIELQFKSGALGYDIGVTTDRIDFYTLYTGHNKINVQSVNTISDSSLKSNILPLNSGLSKLMKINCFKYDLLDPYYDSSGKKTSRTLTNYGFLSQQIEREFEEVDITTNSHGVKLMDYNQILPVVVKATQEQQQAIESLQKEVEELKSELERIKNQGINNNSGQDNSADIINNKAQLVGNILYQNNPNPFNESTSIKYKVETENFKSGSILIFDMNGTLLKTYPIRSGNSEVKINGSELKSGMYIYSLVVNDKEIDTKRMILSK